MQERVRNALPHLNFLLLSRARPSHGGKKKVDAVFRAKSWNPC